MEVSDEFQLSWKKACMRSPLEESEQRPIGSIWKKRKKRKGALRKEYPHFQGAALPHAASVQKHQHRWF